MRALYDCRENCTERAELILVDTKQTANLLKGFRDATYQALMDVRIHRAPCNEQDIANDEDAGMFLMAVGAGFSKLRYGRVIIIRRDVSEDITGIIETVQRFCPELLDQRRLYVTEFRAPPDELEWQRAIQAAQPV
jgi:DNA gyrase/topoisomerase IV subunit B